MIIPGLEKLDMVARMNPAKRLKMWPKIVWKSGLRGGILFQIKIVKKRRSETSITTKEEKSNQKLRVNLEVEFVKTVKEFFDKNFYQQITFISR